MGAGVAIAIIVIIVLAAAYVLYVKNEEQKTMDKGCVPAAWNQFGIASIWNCPAGIKP
jgi:hypothetical protein